MVVLSDKFTIIDRTIKFLNILGEDSLFLRFLKFSTGVAIILLIMIENISNIGEREIHARFIY
jgi:hypothetical protein